MSEEDNNYNPNSPDSVFSTLITELKLISARLDKVDASLNAVAKEQIIIKQEINSSIESVEKNFNFKINELKVQIDERIKEIDKRVISLEYFKYYLAGITATCSIIAGYLFNKFFDLDRK